MGFLKEMPTADEGRWDGLLWILFYVSCVMYTVDLIFFIKSFCWHTLHFMFSNLMLTCQAKKTSSLSSSSGGNELVFFITRDLRIPFANFLVYFAMKGIS